MRDILVVAQQLLGILGQTVAAVAERRIVVMRTDAGVEANPFDNLSRAKPLCLGIGVELVEKRYT